MDCFKCGNKLSGLRQIEVMQEEADLSKLLQRPHRLPKEYVLCSECKKLLTGEKVEH